MVFQLRALCNITCRMRSELLSMVKSWSGAVGVGSIAMVGAEVEVESTPRVTGRGVRSTVTFNVPQAERVMGKVKNNRKSFLSMCGSLGLECWQSVTI
jgi:hypothetical protein